MHGRALAVGLWLIMLLLLFSCPSAAETNGEALTRECPYAAMAANLQKRAEEASALNDSEQYALYKKAARLYYHCSREMEAGSPKDWATLTYATDLFLSLHTNGDFLEGAPIVITALNGLAYTTEYDYIRAGALRMKALAKKGFRGSYYEVNGVYPDE